MSTALAGIGIALLDAAVTLGLIVVARRWWKSRRAKSSLPTAYSSVISNEIPRIGTEAVKGSTSKVATD